MASRASCRGEKAVCPAAELTVIVGKAVQRVTDVQCRKADTPPVGLPPRQTHRGREMVSLAPIRSDRRQWRR